MKVRVVAAVLFALTLLAVPTAASAQTVSVETESDEVAPEVTTFVIFGTGIVLTVGVGSAGNLSSVEIVDDPTTDAPADAVATSVSPHKVKFLLDEDGVRVEVKSSNHKFETRVKARSLADLLGLHGWSGELFGAGNGLTELRFLVGEADGLPTIELDDLTGPGEYSSTTSQETGDDEVEVRLRIKLVDSEGHEARIDIEVEVEVDDGDLEAKIKIRVRSEVFDNDETDRPLEDPTVNTPIRNDDDDHDGDGHRRDRRGHDEEPGHDEEEGDHDEEEGDHDQEEPAHDEDPDPDEEEPAHDDEPDPDEEEPAHDDEPDLVLDGE